MSINRPDSLGGVDGNRCCVFRGEASLCDVDGADSGTVGIALCAFGGLPRRFFGDPVAVICAGADAGGLDELGKGLCSTLGGAD